MTYNRHQLSQQHLFWADACYMSLHVPDINSDYQQPATHPECTIQKGIHLHITGLKLLWFLCYNFYLLKSQDFSCFDCCCLVITVHCSHAVYSSVSSCSSLWVSFWCSRWCSSFVSFLYKKTIFVEVHVKTLFAQQVKINAGETMMWDDNNFIARFQVLHTHTNTNTKTK